MTLTLSRHAGKRHAPVCAHSGPDAEGCAGIRFNVRPLLPNQKYSYNTQGFVVTELALGAVVGYARKKNTFIFIIIYIYFLPLYINKDI